MAQPIDGIDRVTDVDESDKFTLLLRCYQDRTNEPHEYQPCHSPDLWFFVGLGCLRLDFLKFVNRRSSLLRFR